MPSTALALALCALAPCRPAAAESTAPGTTIENVARLSYAAGADARTIDSNVAVVTVARLVDVAVTAAAETRPFGTAAQARVEFQVRNTGNDAERFVLAAAATPAQASVAGIAVAGTVAATPTIALAAGESRTVVVLVDLATDARYDAAVVLTATAAGGHGAPGTMLAGDTLLGTSGGRASARTLLTGGIGSGASAGEADNAPSLLKSQSVRAPDGSARVARGSVITYRLEARFPDATAGVTIDDVVPAGTAYVPGSLMLDGAAVSDRADGDPGTFDGTAVHVALGAVPRAATRIVQFQTVIQ